MCKNFEITINSIHNKMIYDIYLTGSNAFLLSSDLATLFTGRYMEVEVFPFSFKEFVEYFDFNDDYNAFEKFVEYGGFPGSFVYEDASKKTNYINNVIDVVLTTSNKIANYLMSQGLKIDHKTVDNYLEYLCRAFVFYKVKRYDIKGQTYLQTNDKYYLVDTSARVARLGHRNLDVGRVYENIVAIELLRRGYELYAGKLYQKEIDFVAIKGNEKIYIQASDNITAKDTLERELEPLRKIKDAYPKVLIANTRFSNYDLEGIKVLDLTKWLLS